MAAAHRLKPPGTRRERVRVTVWLDERAAWHARAEWGRAGRRCFDSPFELARFMAQLLVPPPGRGGLR